MSTRTDVECRSRYNFAYSGGTIDQKLVPPFSSSVGLLTDQVGDFLAWNTKQSTKPRASDNAMFSIWVCPPGAIRGNCPDGVIFDVDWHQ